MHFYETSNGIPVLKSSLKPYDSTLLVANFVRDAPIDRIIFAKRPNAFTFSGRFSFLLLFGLFSLFFSTSSSWLSVLIFWEIFFSCLLQKFSLVLLLRRLIEQWLLSMAVYFCLDAVNSLMVKENTVKSYRSGSY